jgi:hypothetical protein
VKSGKSNFAGYVLQVIDLPGGVAVVFDTMLLEEEVGTDAVEVRVDDQIIPGSTARVSPADIRLSDGDKHCPHY